MCDIYQHMNVQHYVAAISDSFFSLMTEVGLGKSAIDEHEIGLVAVNMNIDYLAEVHAGNVVYMRAAIERVGGKKMSCLYRLYDLESGVVAMKARVLYVCMDLAARRSRDIPEPLVLRAQADAVGEGADGD